MTHSVRLLCGVPIGEGLYRTFEFVHGRWREDKPRHDMQVWRIGVRRLSDFIRRRAHRPQRDDHGRSVRDPSRNIAAIDLADGFIVSHPHLDFPPVIFSRDGEIMRASADGVQR